MVIDAAIIQQRILPHYFSSSCLQRESMHVTPLGNGHINTTWLVKVGSAELVLQQINTQVFPMPWNVVENAQTIANFLQQQRQANQYSLQVTAPIATLAGKLAVEDHELGFWRAITLVTNSHSIEQMHSPDQANKTAVAFGEFVAALGGLDASTIKTTIADFRNLAVRYQALQLVIEADRYSRVKHCQQWLDYAVSQQILVDEIAKTEALLPLRINHNDTKINNLLFDSADKPSAVVDLDTCMPGYLMYDFGDMVRSCCAAVAEDSTQLNDVQLLPEYLSAISDGWHQALGSMMTSAEKDSLWLGVKAVTLMLAIRFITDYLDGDRYFKTLHAEHNLQRAVNQFTLYQRLLSQESTLKPLLSA